MKLENGKIEGDLVVSEDLQLNGMVTGNIIVTDSAKLLLNGMCLGSVHIEGDSTAIVHGIVQENIENSNGTLHVYGTVNGDVISGSGETKISSEARVCGSIKTSKKQTDNSVIAATVGGAVIGNLLVPGIGGAIAGGVIGAILGHESKDDNKENSNE